MKVVQITAPTIEPITLAELKTHLRIDSGALTDNLDETESIAPGSYDTTYELMTLDVAPGGAGWAAGDTLTGATSHETCTVVTVITTKTYIVKSRSGAFTLGEVISNGADAADQGAANPTFAVGFTILGAAVDVLGYEAIVSLISGTNAATGTLDVKVQDSDDGTTWADWSTAFTQVTTATDNTTYKKAYTGAKKYIRTVAEVLHAACNFGTSVIRATATAYEDTILNTIITAGREYVEDITRRGLLTQTWDYFPANWPGRHGYRGIPSMHSGRHFNHHSELENYFIAIPFGNLQIVSSVKWKDVNGTETTLTENTDYIVETNGEQCGRIVLPWGVVWPTGMLWPSNPISIRFVCGWTTAALVPYKIKAALKLICADLYENREAFIEAGSRIVIAENLTTQRLLASARLWDEFI
jgi:hypothetical protein